MDATDASTFRTNWKRMAQCSPALIAPSKYVSELMELTLAIGGRALNDHYANFRADSRGRDLLERRPDLVAALADREALADLPDGSLGRAYLEFTSRYRFDAAAFDQVHEVDAMGSRLGWDDDQTWVIKRGLQLHDVWHTLTGYGPDWAGETALIHFTHGQLGLGGTATLCRIMRSIPGGVDRRRWARFVRQARVRGEVADNLTVIAYEDLLDRPIDEVRQQLGIITTETIHPGGVPHSAFRYGVAKTMDAAYEPAA